MRWSESPAHYSASCCGTASSRVPLSRGFAAASFLRKVPASGDSAHTRTHALFCLTARGSTWVSATRLTIVTRCCGQLLFRRSRILQGSFVADKCEQELHRRCHAGLEISRKCGFGLRSTFSSCAVAFFRVRLLPPRVSSREPIPEPVRVGMLLLLQRTQLIRPSSQLRPRSLSQNQKKKRKSAGRL